MVNKELVETGLEIAGGLFKFGTLPVEMSEDLNGNGQLDPGEDFDLDGKLDVVEGKTGIKYEFDPKVDDKNGNQKYDEGEPKSKEVKVFDPQRDDADGDATKEIGQTNNNAGCEASVA